MSVIPNSLFVSEPVINESYTDDYILHVFTVPFKREDNWHAAREKFLEAANRHCQSYIEDVRKHMKQLSKKKGLDIPTVEPRVTIQIPVAGEVHLIIRIPTKSNQRSYIEQSILSEVLINNNFSTQKGE